MSSKTIDVTAIGNAIVDVMARASDEFLREQGMVSGSMELVDKTRAEALYAIMGQTSEVSGGSAANSLAGMAQLGAQVAFIGKVADDPMGQHFRHDIRAVGVRFDTPSAESVDPGTGRCLINVAPDGERTMRTYLGAAGFLRASDIDHELIARSKIVFSEGYMWHDGETKKAILDAFAQAHKTGGKVAFSLSAEFCIEMARAEFQQMIAERTIHILFANEKEILCLYPGETLESAMAQAAKCCDTVAITRAEQGSIVLHHGQRTHVPPKPVARVIDATGAGDLYAAGLLYGMTHGYDMARAGALASACAAEIITQLGARAVRSLAELKAAA